MPNLGIRKLKESPESQVLIVGQGKGNKRADLLSRLNTWGVKAFVIGDFAIAGSNDFQSLFELSGQEELQKKLLMIESGAATLGISLPNMRIKSIEQSEVTWLSSNTPEFSIQLLLLSIEEDDDIRKDIRTLLETVFPAFTPGAKIQTLRPPLGYKPRSKSGDMAVSGTVVVTVGKWFRATKQVIKSVNFSCSKEVVKNGSPLYATGTVEFGPYRMISAFEMKNYLRSA